MKTFFWMGAGENMKENNKNTEALYGIMIEHESQHLI
jgi:hypothetical protein